MSTAMSSLYEPDKQQHPEGEDLYQDAVFACQSIEALELTVSDIARMHHVEPACLRNYLKRHFPDILPQRRALREKLGYSKTGSRGAEKTDVEKYADAVRMLEEDSSLTVREVAERCEISFSGLLQQLISYHNDLAQSLGLFRADALPKTGPDEQMAALFAPALKEYRETEDSIPQIAARHGMKAYILDYYLRKWHPEDVMRRRMSREERLSAKKRELALRPDRSAAAVARRRYAPAIPLLQEGMTLTQAAKLLGVEMWNLSMWLHRNHPEILEETRAGLMKLPSGQKTLRRSYDRFLPIAEYISRHPSRSTKDLSEKFNVSTSYLVKYMRAYFPEQWKRHCIACKDKAKRLRKKGKTK